MRIPGEGTSLLINRRQEAAVYRTLDGKGICDEIVSINPENGYKITKYLEGARVCDPENPEDVQACMKKQALQRKCGKAFCRWRQVFSSMCKMVHWY